MLPSAEALHLRRVTRNLFRVLCEQDLEGNRNPQGGETEAEERAAAGRMKSPDAVTEQKAGYKMEDTCQRKVLICTLAAEVRRHRSYVRATEDSNSKVQSAIAVASRQVLVRPLHHARRQMGESSRVGSKMGHKESRVWESGSVL